MAIIYKRAKALIVVCVALILGAGLAACGNGQDKQTASKSDMQAERAFLQGMVPHHDSAIAMGKIAQRRAEHDDVRLLGGDISAGQEREISQMKRIYKRLFGKPLKPDMMAHAKLGLSAKQAGMDHMDAQMSALEKAKPFDRAFIDAMVPHHQGAIRMARAVLAKAKDPELSNLAQSIIGEQGREIGDMNDWRKRWYGAASPAGGVPSKSGGGGGMEHQGHSM